MIAASRPDALWLDTGVTSAIPPGHVFAEPDLFDPAAPGPEVAAEVAPTETPTARADEAIVSTKAAAPPPKPSARAPRPRPKAPPVVPKPPSPKPTPPAPPVPEPADIDVGY